MIFLLRQKLSCAGLECIRATIKCCERNAVVEPLLTRGEKETMGYRG